MARIFRIKNGFLRWLAGLIALAIDTILQSIKLLLIVAAVGAVGVSILMGIGAIIHHLLPLIGISDPVSKEVWSIFLKRLTLGFMTLLVAFFAWSLISLLVAAVKWVIKLPAEAKKYGDKYFNSTGATRKN